MRKSFPFLRILIFVLLAAAVGRVSADDKAISASIQAAGNADAYPGAGTIVVFDSTFVKVMDTGLSHVTMHQVTKVLIPSGAVGLAVQRFDYDPLSAFVEIRQVRIFRKDGTIDVLPLESVLDHAAPARAIYWGAREKMVPVGRLEVGDALETVVYRKGFTYALLENPDSYSTAGFSATDSQDQGDDKYIPPMRGHFYDIVPFSSSAPVKVKVYTVAMPPDKPLQFEVYNGETLSWIHFEKDRTIYRWEKKNIPVFERETNMVAESDVAPKLLVSTSPDWIAKSLWFCKVNEDYGSFEFTPEIKRKVDELVKNCKTDMEKIYVLTHWAAEEIRYSGLSMGPGEGYTLHKGSMDFRDRCGVCKDKAGMLITLLRAAGFESYPAMTMAGSRIDRIPADQFNHSVVVWKRGKGDYVLLDPTWVPGVRELWSSAEQQQEYLMGIPEGADLKTTPISPPENHYFRVRAESQLSEDGTITGKVVVEAEGQSDARMRRTLRGWKALRRTYFENALYAMSPRAELLGVEYQDPYDLSKPMRISIEYRIPGYAVAAGNRLVFIPLAARHWFGDQGTNSYLFLNYTIGDRKYDFGTSCSRLVDFEETIILPKGYKTEHVPAWASIQGDAADFSARYDASKDRIRFVETLSMKKRIYPASEWPNFRDAVKALKTVSESPVIVSKP